MVQVVVSGLLTIMEVIAPVEPLEAGLQVIAEIIGTMHLFVTPIYAQVIAKILVKMEAIVTRTSATVSNKFSNQKSMKKIFLHLHLMILTLLNRKKFKNCIVIEITCMKSFKICL